MFGLEWYFWLILIGIIILIAQIVMMFLLPFFVFKIRNTLLDMSADLDSIAKNVYAIGKHLTKSQSSKG